MGYLSVFSWVRKKRNSVFGNLYDEKNIAVIHGEASVLDQDQDQDQANTW